MFYNLKNNIKLILFSVIITLGITSFIYYISGGFDRLVQNKRNDTKINGQPLSKIYIQTNAHGNQEKIKKVYKVIDTDEKNNIEIYKKISPGVVNITNQVLRYDFFFEPFLKIKGVGSGCVIDKQGHILTNYHVIQQATKIIVTLNKERFFAKVIGSDPENDLAIIKIDAPKNKLFPIKLSKSSNLEVGEKVLAIGNPFGLEKTLTSGIISSVGRTIIIPSGHYINRIIQTDAAINPGNSGGPLLNKHGEMIGINTSIISPSKGSVGIGFAVPSETINPVVNDLIKYGRARRPKLGISGFPLSKIPGLSKYLNLPTDYGILTYKIAKNSAAARAGIRGATHLGRVEEYYDVPMGGDVIISIDNIRITDYRDISLALRNKRGGETIPVGIIRKGKSMEITVTLIAPE